VRRLVHIGYLSPKLGDKLTLGLNQILNFEDAQVVVTGVLARNRNPARLVTSKVQGLRDEDG
jgi:hypothetical protein